MRLLAIWLVFHSVVAVAQPVAGRQQHFNLKKGLAIQGYDPVSYFKGKPVEGSEKFQSTYQGVIYWFSNASNLNQFNTNPASFEPAYGGWCAYAMGETGEKVKVDPETFKIVNGKLYLFYNFWGNNTLESWNKNEPTLKEKGDRNWKEIVR